MFGALARRLFGTANDRYVKSLGPLVDQINELEPELEKLSDEELRARTAQFRQRLADGAELDDILIDAFATVREASKRTLGQRHFNVQLMGGIVLHRGMIAEMKTGEGKTLVATLPVYLNALTGNGVHVVTVNDYLARRDDDWMGQLYSFLCLTVGVLVHDLYEMQRTVAFTESGVEKIEELLRQYGLMATGSLYDIQNVGLVHHVNQALRAHKLFARDTDYISKDDKIIIIDEFTGRMMEGRRYSEGLHQALEAKEGVTVQNENQTLASITFQNYFRLYPKLAGMTGTAMTESQEFSDIYKLEVIEIPTNEPCIRDDTDDEVYRTTREKYDAIVQHVLECQKNQQPMLIGTVSIEKSEALSALFKKHKIPHNVLNARYHEQEAHIIAQAGRPGTVTIATNMAGRGTDIQLGGNLEMRLRTDLAAIDDPA